MWWSVIFFSLFFYRTSSSWYTVHLNATSWKDATPSNTLCVPDTYGNYITQTACSNTLPQPQFHPPCPNCADFDDITLILNYRTWSTQLWSQIYSHFGFSSSTSVNTLWSPLQIAKIWIVTTLKNASNPVISSSPKYSSGGPGSCVNALTVGLQEGATTGVDGTVTYPYNDGAPRHIYDPAWNTGGTPNALCAPISGTTPEQCVSGSIWQVSNAWAGNTCDACTAVGCYSLQNPLCATRVTFQFAKMATLTQPCRNLVSSGATECSPDEYHHTVDPRCFNGPFCLDTNGWNSPACEQMFRQVYPNEGLPYCRLAVLACAQARGELLTAYEEVVKGNSEFLADLKVLQAVDTTNAGIEGLCPANPGDYSIQPPQCS